MADSTPFTDVPLNVHWHSDTLYDDDYAVGKIGQGFGKWEAWPYWNEEPQLFDTQEEAQSWLLAVYKMGGCNEPIQLRRPAAK